jgi:tetratricopeptide (TPR) repeat protein
MNDNLFEFALSHYKRAVKLAPTKQLIYYNLANCLSRMGLMDEAILWSKKAVELDKTDPEPHYHMGNIYLNHKFVQTPDFITVVCIYS